MRGGYRNGPCKGREDRHMACHDTCERYKAWQEKINLAKKEKAKENLWLAVHNTNKSRTIKRIYGKKR